MAISFAASPAKASAFDDPHAAAWARALGQVFRRVAVFAIRGRSAEVVALSGLVGGQRGTALSLLEPTPLRWAVQAASPIVGAGRAPGGEIVPRALGLEPPRAYAVIPLLRGERLVALAYVDQAGAPIPLADAARAFTFCRDAARPEEPRAPVTRGRPPLARRGRRPRRPRPPGLRSLRPRPRPGPPEPDAGPEKRPEPPRRRAPRRSETSPSIGLELADYAPRAPSPSSPASREGAVARVVAREEQARRTETEGREPSHTGTLAVEEVVVTRAEVRRVATRRVGGARVLGGLVGMALILLGVGSALVMAPPSGERDRDHRVTIAQGETLSRIATILEEEGVIRSATAFKLLARLRGLDAGLRAGNYRLPAGAWMPSVLRELHRGQLHQIHLTIPEGLTLEEIAARVEAAGLAKANDFLLAATDVELLARHGIPATSAEGYLFPETYVFAEGVGAKGIVEAMIGELEKRVRQIPAAASLTPTERHRWITLASIVEREAKAPDERARIAGVFRNRLERHMKLESCATVQYVLGERKERLLLEDVRKESPYNTYLNPGLPPGPIANPGLGALEAALHPERHDYLFFVARRDGSGRHIFSKTYSEHLKAQRSLPR